MVQPGKTQLRCMAASAMRWPGVAVRACRPWSRTSPFEPSSNGMILASQARRRTASGGTETPSSVSQTPTEVLMPLTNVSKSQRIEISGRRTGVEPVGLADDAEMSSPGSPTARSGRSSPEVFVTAVTTAWACSAAKGSSGSPSALRRCRSRPTWLLMTFHIDASRIGSRLTGVLCMPVVRSTHRLTLEAARCRSSSSTSALRSCAAVR